MGSDAMTGWVGEEASGRRGGVNPAVLVLLSGILVALIVLIVILATQMGGDGTGAGGGRPTGQASGPSGAKATPVVAEGQTIRRSELPAPPESPKPVGDPDRIRQTLQAGKTYQVVIKAGLDARVEDKAWGIKEVVSLAYAAEMEVDRTVESNDGKRVVELRHFVTSRNVKLLCNVEGVTIDLGLPGVLLLGALETLQPGAGAVAVAAKPVAESLLGLGAEAVARSRVTKAVAHVDTLSGKKVRITYVDGVGVEAIEPVGCSLTAEERDFAFGTAILSDCYILPDVTLAPGKTWQVDGAQLAGLLDPSLRGRPTGRVVIAREADSEQGGKRSATLRVKGGTMLINSSDESTRRIGSFTPEGTLRFSLADGYVDRATLTGRFVLESVSTDHILFETSFRSRPTLQIDYACTIR